IFSRAYQSMTRTFIDIQKAHKFKQKEYDFNARRMDEIIADYALESINIKRKLTRELRLLEHLKRDVSARYRKNIGRVLKGKSLIQTEEEKCGLKYFLTHSSKFSIEDNERFEKVKSDLENMVSGETNHSSKSNKTYNDSHELSSIKSTENYVATLDEGCALYLNSYDANCYTNKIAKISAGNSGSIKQIANALSGYVSGGDDKIISPHKRTWESRVNNIEELILKNNFTQSDRDKLSQIKDTLSKNKYLTTKKKEQYEKINKLLDNAIERGEYV
ncbi:MAG: hypothetical protein ACOC2U_02945, partial [bacterium]